MNTTQNRAMVLASFLRTAAKHLKAIRPERGTKRYGKPMRPIHDDAVEAIEQVALELEETAGVSNA